MGSRRALITPQNTFIESVTRRLRGQECSFVLGSARIAGYPVIYASESFHKMTGYDRTDAAQQSCTLDFMWDEVTDEQVKQNLLSSLDKHEQFQAEIRMRCKNRTPLWISYRTYPVFNEKNAVIMFLCVLQDITSQKQPIKDDESKLLGLSRIARLVKQAAKKDLNPVTYSKMVGNREQPTLVAPLAITDRFPPYRPEAPKAAPDILLHYSPFKSGWDWLILVLTVYTSMAVPLFFAFKYKTNQLPLNVANSLVDVVFFVDLVLNFHTTFGGGAGDVITEPHAIRIAYLRSWFAVDLLSCLPYDIFNAFQYSDATTSSALNTLKLLRLLRVGRVARKLDHYIEYSAALLILILGIFIVCGHWFACIWYLIGTSEVSKYRYNWLNSLANLTGVPYTFANDSTVDGGPEIWSAYVTALYFALSCMTSVGFGNVSSATDMEKVFACCMMILGALLYASIFGNITAIMQQFVASSSKYRDLLHDVKQFVKLYHIPRDLSERISDYVVSLWVVTKGVDHDQILDHCPKDMRADISVHLHRKVLKDHPGFRLASDGCLRALALQFNIVHSAPGDLLYHQCESVDQLCFVISGSLEVVQDDEVVGILGVGDTFGDDFWNHDSTTQSSASVRAMTYCSIHSIKRDKLLQVLEFYQAFYSAFKRNMSVTYSLRKRFVFRKVQDVAREKELEKQQQQSEESEARGNRNHFVRKFLTKLAQSVVNLRDGERSGSAAAAAEAERGESLEVTLPPATQSDSAPGAGDAPDSGDAERRDDECGVPAADCATADAREAAPATAVVLAGAIRKCPTSAELLLFRQVIQKELEELAAKLTVIERYVENFSSPERSGRPQQHSLRQSTVSQVSTAHILLEGVHGEAEQRDHSESTLELGKRSSPGGGGGDRRSPKRSSPMGKKLSSVHPAPPSPSLSSLSFKGAAEDPSNWLQMNNLAVTRDGDKPKSKWRETDLDLL